MSEMPSPLHIEPLPAAAWRRVEDKVFASLERHARSGQFPVFRPRERRSRTLELVSGLALAASVSLLWLAVDRAPRLDARSADVAPRPSASSAGAGSSAAPESGRIATTTDPVDVAVGDSVVTVAPRSVVQVQGNDAHGWALQLQQGEVGCRVAPRPEHAPFVVHAGDTTVTVVGTRFNVSRAGERARVSVQEGIVRVERAGRVVRLYAGDSWPPEEQPPHPQANAAPAPALAESEDRAVPLAVSPGAVSPHAAAPGAVPPHAAAPGDRRLPRDAEHDQGQTRAREAREARRALPEGPPGGAWLDSQRLFERASRLEASDPKAALDLYRRVGARGPWAANALYGRARLELELGNTSRAQRALELYLRRYPQGSNAADVRALLASEP